MIINLLQRGKSWQHNNKISCEQDIFSSYTHLPIDVYILSINDTA
ncbi:hypothetical protein HMPREF0663_10472 [Hoylesella oralis ATCC 33269]|uniref:Uncharacterized protein n=1 Tax=Hoylesella oralis ATCC 33269 TaxID=873533 RepID=E7RMX2_9BACT|nr:hypothetical protein HMPREF0663_10472 [Hoylesella oralis ATCC 33269]